MVILNRTPFYAESGGQIGDHGDLRGDTGIFQVQDTQRPLKGFTVHYGELSEGYLRVGETVQADVDELRRENTMRNHSATHLLHKALRNRLGTQVQQRGSLVEPERLRFDFSSPRALNGEDLQHIDAEINRWIRANYSVTTNIMPIQDAMETGAMALFGEKYDDLVRVVSMGSSIELCGGTHCRATGQIGTYITIQETSIAAGIRRIEALTGSAAEEYLLQRSETVDTIASTLQVQPDQVQSRIEQLLQDLAAARRQIANYQRNEAVLQAQNLVEHAKEVADVAVIAASVNVADAKVLREMGDMVRTKLQHPGVVVLASDLGDRSALQVSVDPALTKRGLHAGKIAGEVGARLGGKGGGRPDSAQGGGKDKTALPAALDLVTALVRDNLK
jgi:alanyl-tRNA synthetase